MVKLECGGFRDENSRCQRANRPRPARTRLLTSHQHVVDAILAGVLAGLAYATLRDQPKSATTLLYYSLVSGVKAYSRERFARSERGGAPLCPGHFVHAKRWRANDRRPLFLADQLP